ncbi:MAG: hypothetical protein KGO53_09975, partial [Alphaproteobacteria bacterium]|nr:hypothetical protein [Alphaproteobacteria bacterium]
MKKFVMVGAAVGALVLGAQVAQAADAAAPHGWTGFYSGMQLGYASAGGQINDYNGYYQYDNGSVGWLNSSSGNNMLLGGKVGYDFDTGSNVVLGLSADVQALLGEDAKCSSLSNCDTGANGQPHLSFGVKGLAALDARAGFVMGQDSLVYVEGG